MSVRYLKVEGHSNLVRDTRSNAIVNTNKSDFEVYMKRMKMRQSHQDEIRGVCREINTLKTEMFEIKSLIKELVNKNGS